MSNGLPLGEIVEFGGQTYLLPLDWRFIRRGSSYWLNNGLTRIVSDKGSPGGDKTVLVQMKINDKGKEEVEWSQVLS